MKRQHKQTSLLYVYCLASHALMTVSQFHFVHLFPEKYVHMIFS